MGNRSRYIVATAAAGAAIAAARRRRRARLRRVVDGIRGTILPTHVGDLPTERPPADDEAHAPGHRHRPVVEVAERGPRHLRSRPWERRIHGERNR